MHSRLVTAAALAGVLLAGGLAAAPSASAAPPAPVLTSVAGGASNPVLSWAASTGAVKYSVDVASQSDFASGTVRYSITTGNTAATPPNDLALGTYWWRVRAQDSAGAWGSYAVGSFAKTASTVPALATPADGQVLNYPDNPLVLSWAALPGAKTYEVQVDDDAAFVGAPAPVSTTNTAYTPDNPSFNTDVFWRVRAKSAQGVATDWSAVRSYRMTWPTTQVPTLVSPADLANVEEVTLDWAPLKGANSYELQISPDQFFNNPIGGTETVNSTSFSPSPTLAAGSYYWRVRGLSAVLNSAQTPEPSQWSAVRTFTRAWPSTGSLPRGTDPAASTTSSQVKAASGLPQVTLVSPANGDYSGPREPTFVWNPQREASNYEIQIGSDPNFSPSTYNSCVTDHTVFTPYNSYKPFTLSGQGPSCNPVGPNKPSPGAVRYWRVRALDGPATNPVVYGAWSDTRSMQYNPSALVQSSNTSDTAPVLSWTPVPNISRYKVTIAPASGNTNTKCTVVTAFTYNTSYVPEGLDPACSGQLAWTVQTAESDNDLGKLAYQPSWPTFYLVTPTPQSSMGTVRTIPSDGLKPPTMLWDGLTNATKYKIWYSLAGANSYSLAGMSTLPGNAYTGTVSGGGWPATLAAGNYTFYVEAYDKSSVLIGNTQIGSFSIASTWPSVTLNGPCVGVGNCELADTPTFSWTPVPGIGIYHVYVATDPNFTNTVWDWGTNFSTVTPIMSLPDSQAGQAYYWYVRPCTTDTSCAPFDSSVFGRAGSFRKVSKPVEALSPTAQSAAPADEVTFTWRDYLATNYADTVQRTNTSDQYNQKVNQEAASYQVQVSTTAEFTNIIETSPLVDQTTYTPQTVTYPDGPLYWRVRAFDKTGNPLTYSCAPVATSSQPACSTFGFQKKSAAPTLDKPTAGATVPSAPALQWLPMPYAKSYDVEVYTGSSVNPASRVVALSTKGTSVIARTPLAKGTYGWRVRRVDARGIAGSWTSEFALRTFVVSGNPVTLYLPGNGATTPDNRVVLQWLPVAGASRYKVEASVDSGFGTLLESMTTDMTSWAPSLVGPKWPTGRIYWRVTSLDANNSALATSATWSLVRGSGTTPPPPTGGTGGIVRYAGSDRYGTAVAVSKATFPSGGVPVAYIATGTNFADALSGGPAASRQGGPVLLVTPTAIPSAVGTELSRLKPAKIVILGGTGAVSAGVATKLDAFTTGPVVRLAGSNRFDTAGKVARYAFGTSSKAYVASGENYPDALAGAVAAAVKGQPLLLVTQKAVPAPTSTTLQAMGVTSTTVLGGTGAVSDAVMRSVKGTVRLSGSDRYATAAAISRATFATAAGVFLATGRNFPDALSGTPGAAAKKAPLLLANGGCLTAATAAEIKRLGAKTVYVLGGTGAVPQSAAQQTIC
ncbi:cell wall-binding repeat-containing protein [Phycicoccus sp. 3266]|uniref:cell wall-binding repeat-containing protein n=1 Tax=Phycicoccus sp. 3266 TaxID=2817751 RepID=UPI002859ABF8|nr:cell wall-binding repeat-containing protein [Phycicoccus sp. 3266]MDR6862235.1 putative cell wall-binding protein [Phycicoccus sp. 3266]